MIGIVDYGAGNLQSVQNAFAKAGAEFELVRDADSLGRSEKIVLPGVGHFGQMMRALDELGMRAALRERIGSGVPFLGVCLGMQALFEGSAEAPEAEGLAVFRGRVERFPDDLHVPHMGWNTITPASDSRLFAGQGGHVYFAHSFYVPVVDEAAAICAYSRPFSAAVERDNCFGVQFHPEKSGPFGLEIIQRFAAL